MTKNIIIIVLSFTILTLAFFLWRVNSHNDNKRIVSSAANKVVDTTLVSTKNPYLNAIITTEIISSEENTFGYDVLVDGQILIHQPSIPGISGNKGFETEQQAQRVANFVATKVKNNEMPPTVTNEDLNELLNNIND